MIGKLKLKRSDTPGKTPTQLDKGEIAANIADGFVYIGTSDDEVVEISGVSSLDTLFTLGDIIQKLRNNIEEHEKVKQGFLKLTKDENFLAKIKRVDGEGSGIDADKVDNFHASQSPTGGQIPVLNSNGQLPLPFAQTPILVNGQDMMSRTFYVDAVNGDDGNDGSESAPFKTLQKAVDSVPTGGRVIINLKSDYTEGFSCKSKTVKIEMTDGITWTIPMGAICDITGSYILIRNRGTIIVDRGDGSNINGDNYAGFRVTNFEGRTELAVPTTLYIINDRNNSSNLLRVDADRYLCGSRMEGAPNQNVLLNFAFYNLYSPGDIVLDGGFVKFNGGAGTFQYGSVGNAPNIIDSNGNSVDIKDKVSGIIKDANGVPRNILSNIVF